MLSGNFESGPLGFLTPALGTLAYYLLLVARRRRWEKQSFGDEFEETTDKQVSLRWWRRPSTILALVVGGFFVFKVIQDPTSRFNWFASEIVFCLAFIIRDWENQAFRDQDESEES